MKTLNSDQGQSATEAAMIKIAVLYLMGQKNNRDVFDTITIDPVIEGPVRNMKQEGLLLIKSGPTGDYYAPSPAGHHYINLVRDLADRVIDLGIFARVCIQEPLTGDYAGSDGVVYDNIHDPRFFTKEFAAERPDLSTVDMRLWMIIDHLNQKLRGHTDPVNPYLVVFVQRLIDGELVNPANLWVNLRTGRVYREIDEIVRTAFRIDPVHYQNGAECTPDYWFSAGMRELAKRRGPHCGNCQASLALHENVLKTQNQTLNHCPYCQALFSPPPPPPQPTYTEQCPHCGHGTHPHQRFCHGCNMRFDRSLTPGDIVARTRTTHQTTEHIEYYPTLVVLAPDPLYSLAAWSALTLML